MTRTSCVLRCVFCALTASAVLTAPAAAQVQPHAGMMRYPDVGETHIAFVYANDIWRVPREGGTAVPMASPPGQEAFPRFSPDGGTIAFVGNYEGDRDLYTLPVEGGVPTRVTHHPDTERLNDWTPDGELIFHSTMQSARTRWSHLYTVGPDGGLPEKLPVPYGANGAISPDGRWLAYTPHQRDFRTWKRYRGGMASDIWLFNLETHESRRITDWEGTDTLPMWHGETVYYLSDAGENHKLNIWSYNTRTERRQQVTRFSEFDVKWPSIGPGPNGGGEIVFQNGSNLYLHNIRDGMSNRVEVTIPGARPTIKDKTGDASEFIQAWGVSSTGKRAVVQARGDIWTLPAEHGTPRNLTRTSGAAERDPAWSPDGRWIAYFADATGEYELYITQSDGKGETRQLTSGSETFYYDPVWSPDSRYIAFFDKAGTIFLHDLEEETTTRVDRDPWANQPDVSWSHDSRWLAYDKQADQSRMNSSIWIYNVETGDRRRVTADMFDDDDPVFDRKGDFLYFESNRSFSPMYGELDTSFIYPNTGTLLAAPLRDRLTSPYLPESDEESWDDEEKDEDEAENGEDEAEEENGDSGDAPAEDDGLSGVWEGRLTGDEPIPPGGMDFTLTLTLQPDGSVEGSMSTPLGAGAIEEGSYNAPSGELNLTISFGGGETVAEFTLRIDGESMSGTAVVPAQGVTADVAGKRTQAGGDEDEANGDDDEEARETVEIDFEGLEARAIQLPVEPGVFRGLAVNNKNQLIYVRGHPQGSDETPAIKLFDIEDEKKQEKEIAAGAGAFDITADGKKLLVIQGDSATIRKASPGGAGKPVVRKPMNARIEPRKEWEQIFTDAWRIERDFFYVANMHGVDWPAVRDRYRKMLKDCVDREDVAYVIREMIAELNVGHAYYGGGDFEDEPNMAVGMLGCDYELAQTDQGEAYRIKKIHEGARWDSDARGPLSKPGIDVEEGDFLLAVNGAPVDTDKDPWAALQGLVGQAVRITVSDKPVMDDEAREVVVKPVGLNRERELRYRAWIEENRSYVEDQTDGRVGYVYVPSTGIDGQNDLVRQYYGQLNKDGLIIDERWNSGGQIPTRFVELLNRPVTNYWARRDGNDWPWPPDAHHGPKCMLINGQAGSGGDAFPAYFRQAELGKLIGTRTWGGLVGISGNPGLIDGGGVTAPTFGYYEKDGTWGIEGHGVEPDMRVVDDPALMVDGGDPQLDAAIEHMLKEIERNPYTPPKPPPPPDRSGMGITESEK